jgi:hypothetical protein
MTIVGSRTRPFQIGATLCLILGLTIRVATSRQRVRFIRNYAVGPVGIEPTTEGLRGGGNRSNWSGGVGSVRDSLISMSGGVGFVRWCRFGMWDETWDF